MPSVNARQIEHGCHARILAEWRLSGFEELTGCQPRPDDPIVPSRRGAYRNVNASLRRFHEDLERIGLRSWRQHDARRTVISIAPAAAIGAQLELLQLLGDVAPPRGSSPAPELVRFTLGAPRSTTTAPPQGAGPVAAVVELVQFEHRAASSTPASHRASDPRPRRPSTAKERRHSAPHRDRDRAGHAGGEFGDHRLAIAAATSAAAATAAALVRHRVHVTGTHRRASRRSALPDVTQPQLR
jgi:hypothetical protein